ncbi:hypothetical protein PINS_up020444 [Pythium insidiosum]|nr:hypothetical protein PINS_up020444 [Pythium insidiosum]
MLRFAETVDPNSSDESEEDRAFALVPFLALCVSAASLGVSSYSLYNALDPGRCAVCIERHNDDVGSINMNFKDVAGESNWNNEYFDAGLQRDCTTEHISGSRELKMVQFFSNPHSDHCICRIHISCHKNIAGFDRAWLNLDGDFLTEHWLRTWPGGNPTKDECPDGCIMVSEASEGLIGMNVWNKALDCAEDDTECKHRNVEMW